MRMPTHDGKKISYNQQTGGVSSQARCSPWPTLRNHVCVIRAHRADLRTRYAEVRQGCTVLYREDGGTGAAFAVSPRSSVGIEVAFLIGVTVHTAPPNVRHPRTRWAEDWL